MRVFDFGARIRVIRNQSKTRGSARRATRAGLGMSVAGALVVTSLATAATVLPVGVLAAHAADDQGFNLNPSDLRFILKQIKIAERHARTATPGNPCGTLLGLNEDQIPSNGNQAEELPWGLRTVDGTCNNLKPGQHKFGAADRVFPRLTTARFRDAESGDPDGPGPAPSGPSSYQQKTGTVIDSEPRTISNLIVDQTMGNPAADAVAGGPGADDGSGTLFIPNTAPDAGLSSPYNSMFTLFGQFFDHGLDLTNKSGGTVFIPLKADDPLWASTPPDRRFMAITRATNQPGPDGEIGTPDDVQNATNQTTPFIDQNQTYTSHPSHQVFLREYALDADGDPVATGKMHEGAGGGIANWAETKAQARTMLGIALRDSDVLNVPQLLTDQYGKFAPGPNGFPQLVTTAGPVEGNPATPVSTVNALRTGHAFLDDMAHHANPVGDLDHNPATPPSALTPDAGPGTADDGNPSTYDNEMLDAHFITGDGRGNENIGLSAVHHIFHSEHNRLTEDIKQVLLNRDPVSVPEWELAPGIWNGERIFQAARFVTEMEYQHLAVEEFARRVAPGFNAFAGYDTSINSAIKAEFAHAVYRFGHSMLTETVERTNQDGSENDIALLDAFLNPPEFTNGGPAGVLTPDQAAGAIFTGMTEQTGNEVDEFVTEALRNKLLGLPLDLATVNIARGRDTGIPRLNGVRRQLFEETGNSALQPYTSWNDFGLGLRNQESLVNFVAAYGTHPSILTPTTLAGKRAAANLLVNGGTGAPLDRAAFMSGAAGDTGVSEVDLWVGGLAEKQAPFGGLLGSTFNQVFESQMESLQDGDRFYYLHRTAGLNMLTQLEGNSFAELIARNSTAQGLPADVFARPDYKFNLAAQTDPLGIVDDPATTEYDERVLLNREPDGTIRYSGELHVLFNGTASGDRVHSSEGDDTLRGSGGADRLEGGSGNDNTLGGEGDDIITDLFGDDNIKAGDGNDAVNGGPGLDLLQTGRGSDFAVTGSDPTEILAGPGDDFVLGGTGSEIVIGAAGSDWMETRGGADELIGDDGAPFEDEPLGGHDVLIGGTGAEDHDAEGGDDIMLAGPGAKRHEGMLGFDWVSHKGDPQFADSDMFFTGFVPPSVDALRDRFDLVEGLSGWRFDDILRGDDGIPVELAGEQDPADHALDPAGIARIDGLAEVLLPRSPGATFMGGNIILGGGGNDVTEGRGGDDIIDGDAWLDVQLRAPNLATANPNDTILVDSMEELRADVFAGRLNPGAIEIVRSVKVAAAGTSNNDTAVFSDVRANYTCIVGADPTPVQCPLTSGGESITVEHVTVAPGDPDDGTDSLRRIENLVFSNTRPPGAPNIVSAVARFQSAELTWERPVRGAVDGFDIKVIELDASGADSGREHALIRTGPDDVTRTITGLTNGTSYRFQVRAVNVAGEGEFSPVSPAVTPLVSSPNAPTVNEVLPRNESVVLKWANGGNGGSAITSWQVEVTDTSGDRVGPLRTAAASARSLTVTGLRNGTTYFFTVRAVNAVGNGRWSVPTLGVEPGRLPGAPRIGTAVGRDASAVVHWSAPVDNGGLRINEYQVRVLNAAGNQVGDLRIADGANRQKLVIGLVNGHAYRFRVRAVNSRGEGVFSDRSNAVRPSS